MQYWPAAEILAPTPDGAYRRMVVQEGPLRAGVLALAAGAEIDEHAHLESSEVFHIVSGRAIFDIDDVPHELAPGDLLFVGAGERHGIRVHADEPLVMVIAVAPNLDDAWAPSP